MPYRSFVPFPLHLRATSTALIMGLAVVFFTAGCSQAPASTGETEGAEASAEASAGASTIGDNRAGDTIVGGDSSGVLADTVDSAGSATVSRGEESSSVPAEVERVDTPDTLRGLYVNRWAAVGARMWQLIDVAKRTEINALVIDVKDDRGLVLYPSTVELARKIGADQTDVMSRDRIRAVLDTMRAYSIYPIARIVVVKDPLLAKKKLEWAIQRKSDGAPWLDKNGLPWLDAHQRGVWQYAVDLAREAYDLGFSEVQFDYVRFPDEGRLKRESQYPLAAGRGFAEVIRDQLVYMRGELQKSGIPMSIDVFGLTGTAADDMGIGQKWELFVDQADYVLPMIYPSHYESGNYGLANPNASPYATIDHSLKDMLRRSEGIENAAKIIPWYQDFTMGSPPYGVEQVRAQIQAGYDNGIYSWILWNPGSRYTLGALKASQ